MMQAVCVDEPGGPENLLLRTVPKPQPKDGEVLIKVHATALNRADLLQVLYNILYILTKPNYSTFSLLYISVVLLNVIISLHVICQHLFYCM